MDLVKPLRHWAGRRVLVALSGGADSVALLLLLREAGAEICGAHFEHGIRGAESLRDAAFCRALCERTGVPYIEGSADVPASRLRGEGIESAARRLRYAFLEDARQKMGAELIALAHHMDDQAETVLMHLLRGTGMDGMRGMRAQSGVRIRPLLGVRKAELINWLDARNQPYCTDATNAEPSTPRNRLRSEIIPRLESVYPGAVEAVARHAEIAAQEGDLLAEMADDWLEKHRDDGALLQRLRVDALAPSAILRRALRAWVGASDLDFDAVRALEQLCRARRGAVTLPGKLRAERAGDWLYLLPEPKKRPKSVDLLLSRRTILEPLCEMLCEPCDPVPIRNDPHCQVLAERALHGAKIRTRRDGDRIRPLGMRGSKLLSDYLIDRKVDRPLRDLLPLVAVGSDVLWVVGYGISDGAKAIPGQRAVRLRCRMLDKFPHKGYDGG